jgi:hypothetical protein
VHRATRPQMRPRSTDKPEMEVAQGDLRIARQIAADRSEMRKRSLARCCMRSHAANCVCGRYCFYTGHAVLAAGRDDLPLCGRLCTTINVFTPPPPDNATSQSNVVSKSRSASGSQGIRVTRSGIHCDFELVILQDLDLSAPSRISIPVASA